MSDTIEDNDSFMFINNSNMMKLSSTDRSVLDTEITIDEVQEIIKNLPNESKSLGPDKISNTLLKYIGFDRIILNITNSLLKGEELPASMGKTYIRLIYKKDQRDSLTNHRPICLLSLAYKIIAKMISDRLQKVLGTVICDNQEAYKINGNSQLHSKKIQEMMMDNISKKSKNILLKTDFIEAFDRIHHNYISNVMKYANFPDRISKLILTMISNLKGSVLINYTKTDEFEMKTGVIQGSPLSSLLFILALEPVICTALNKGGLGGFKFFDTTIPLCGFADDLFIITTTQFLPSWLTLLETFGKVSGDKLNLNKCQINVIGNDEDNENDAIEIKKIIGNSISINTNNKFKFIGIEYTYPNKEEQKKSIIRCTSYVQDPLKKCNIALAIFRKGDVKKRIEDTKMYICSLFIYYEGCTEILQKKNQQIQKVINCAIFGKFNSPVKCKVYCLPISCGGFGIPYYESISKSIIVNNFCKAINGRKWEVKLIKRDLCSLLKCTPLYSRMTEKCREYLLDADIIYLLQLTITIDIKVLKQLNVKILATNLNALSLILQFKKELTLDFDKIDKAPNINKKMEVIRQILNLPLFLNQIFKFEGKKLIFLANDFFYLKDIWDRKKKVVDTQILERIYDKYYNFIPESYRKLFKDSPENINNTWNLIIGKKIIEILTEYDSGSMDDGVRTVTSNIQDRNETEDQNENILLLTCILQEFDNKIDNTDKINKIYTSTDSKKISVKKLTIHFNTSIHDTLLITEYTGIKTWIKKNNLNDINWSTIFNFLGDSTLTYYNHYSLLIILHRLYVRRRYKDPYIEVYEEKSSDQKLSILFSKLRIQEVTQINRQYYNCSNCNGNTFYDYEHALFECPTVKYFWILVTYMLYGLTRGCFKTIEDNIGIRTILLLGTDRINSYHIAYNLELVASVKKIFVAAIESLTETGTSIQVDKMQSLFKVKVEAIVNDKSKINNNENNIWDMFSQEMNDKRTFSFTKQQFWHGTDSV